MYTYSSYSSYIDCMALVESAASPAKIDSWSPNAALQGRGRISATKSSRRKPCDSSTNGEKNASKYPRYAPNTATHVISNWLVSAGASRCCRWSQECGEKNSIDFNPFSAPRFCSFQDLDHSAPQCTVPSLPQEQPTIPGFAGDHPGGWQLHQWRSGCKAGPFFCSRDDWLWANHVVYTCLYVITHS